MLVVVTGLLLLSAGGALAQGPPVEKETQRLVTSVSESLRQVLWAFGLEFLRSPEIDLLRRREEPPATGGSPRQTPCLPCAPKRKYAQQLATVFAHFAGFRGR